MKHNDSMISLRSNKVIAHPNKYVVYNYTQEYKSENAKEIKES